MDRPEFPEVVRRNRQYNVLGAKIAVIRTLLVKVELEADRITIYSTSTHTVGSRYIKNENL